MCTCIKVRLCMFAKLNTVASYKDTPKIEQDTGGTVSSLPNWRCKVFSKVLLVYNVHVHAHAIYIEKYKYKSEKICMRKNINIIHMYMYQFSVFNQRCNFEVVFCRRPLKAWKWNVHDCIHSSSYKSCTCIMTVWSRLEWLLHVLYTQSYMYCRNIYISCTCTHSINRHL